MPKQRASGGERLEQALASLTSALTATRAPWMVIGGIATIARGVRRMTTDIDVAIRGDLIVFKAIASRPKDLEDATTLLVLHPGIDRERVRSRVDELATLSEQPELVRGLERMLAASAPEAPPKRSTAKRKSPPTKVGKPRR